MRLPWWRRVRYAQIPDELRERFELFGETVLSMAIASPTYNSLVQGVELVGLMQVKRAEITAWLRERRDLAERREQRLETLEWAILVLILIEVVHDFPGMVQELFAYLSRVLQVI